MKNLSGGMQNAGAKMEQYGKGAYNHLYEGDPKKIFKVGFIIIGLILLFKFGKQLMRFLGLDKGALEVKDEIHQDELEQEIGEHHQDTGTLNPFDTDPTNNNTYGKQGGEWEPPASKDGLYWDEKTQKWYPTAKTKTELKALVDKIKSDTSGYTLFGYDEQSVLRLANLSTAKLKYVMYYWDSKYKAANNGWGIAKYLNSKNAVGNLSPAITVFAQKGWYY